MSCSTRSISYSILSNHLKLIIYILNIKCINFHFLIALPKGIKLCSATLRRWNFQVQGWKVVQNIEGNGKNDWLLLRKTSQWRYWPTRVWSVACGKRLSSSRSESIPMGFCKNRSRRGRLSSYSIIRASTSSFRYSSCTEMSDQSVHSHIVVVVPYYQINK